MTGLEATTDRIGLARMAATGNWNIMRGSATADAELMEMLDEGVFVLIYTSHLATRDMDGVRLTDRGARWLARAEQES